MSVPRHSARMPVPRGLTGVGIFLLFGTAMALLAGTTSVWPRTELDHAWALNQRAHRELAPLGRMIGIPFLLLGAQSSRDSDGKAVFQTAARIWDWSDLSCSCYLPLRTFAKESCKQKSDGSRTGGFFKAV